MITISLSEEEFEEIAKFALRKGVSVSEFVRELTLEKIEEERLLLIFEEALEAYHRNPFSYSLHEVEKELGLR